MAEETAQVEETAQEASATEQAADFLNQGGEKPSDEPSFLDVVGDRFDEILRGEDLQDSQAPATEAPSTEAPAQADAPEQGASTEDLASEFPTADALKETLGDEKAVAKWGELRSELSEARDKVRELESKIDTTEPQVDTSTLESQLSEARSKIEEYEKEVSIFRVEQSDEYKQTITEPFDQISSTVEDIANRNNLDPNLLLDVLGDHNRDRQTKILGDLLNHVGESEDGEPIAMAERDKMTLYSAADRLNELLARDAQLKDRAAEAAAELQVRETAKSEQEAQLHASKVKSAIGEVFDRLESVVPEIEGVDMGDMRKQTSSDDFTKLGAEHQAYALSAGTMLPPLVKAIRGRDSKIAELEAQLAKYQEATPGAGGEGTATTGSTSAPQPDEEMGFLDAIGARLGGQ